MQTHALKVFEHEYQQRTKLFQASEDENFCWTLAKSWGKIGKTKEGREILFYRVEARIQQLWQVNVICSALKFRAQKKKLALIPRSNEYPPRWCSKSASHVQHCFYFFRFIFQPVGLEAPAFIPFSLLPSRWNASSISNGMIPPDGYVLITLWPIRSLPWHAANDPCEFPPWFDLGTDRC